MPVVLHDRLRNRTRVTGTIVTRTGLHVGTGRQSELTDAPVLRDPAGRPFIPGSSFKGALRATVERLLAEEPGGELPWSCRLVAGHPRCLTRNPALQQRFNQALEDEQRGRGPVPGGEPGWLRQLEGLLCDACAVFGSVACAGRMRFFDLPVQGLWAETTEIRDGVGIDRDSRTAAPQIKFTLEVVPADTAFAMEIVADNLDPIGRFLLAAALAELRAGEVRLGGRVTRGLGAVELRDLRISQMDLEAGDARSRLRRYLISRDGAYQTVADPDVWIDEAIGTVLGGEEGG